LQAERKLTLRFRKANDTQVAEA
jgi:hypothetical protein